MTQRTAVVEILAAYFNEIGEILKPSEYRLRTDAPVRYARIKSIFGSWNRMENIVRKHNSRNDKPADYVPVNDVDAVLEASYGVTKPEAPAKEEEALKEEAPTPKEEAPATVKAPAGKK
jgi:hypothetical protein